MSISIRPATIEDSETILSLIQQLAEYERVQPENIGITLEKIKAHAFGENPYFHVLLAEQEQKPIGYALFSFKYSASGGAPVMYLEDLFVQDASRRLGVGKMLFTEMANVANQKQCCRIDWQVFKWNETAVGFYKSIGGEVREVTHYMRLDPSKFTTPK